MVESQASFQRAAIPTTTAFGKLRGFTFTLLKILESESLTTHQIAGKAEKRTNYVQPYLYNLRKYGLASKNDGFWFLTEKGAQIWNLLKRYNNNNNKRRIKEEQKNNKRCSEPRRIQLSLANWNRKSDLNSCEAGIVDYLLNNFNKNLGSKHINVRDDYELAERVGFNVDVVQEALRHLDEEKRVWVYPNKVLGGHKVGLFDAYVDELREDALAGSLRKCNGVGSS